MTFRLSLGGFLRLLFRAFHHGTRCSTVSSISFRCLISYIELFQNSKKYSNKVYTLPKELDEKVASLHLEKVGAKLTRLNQKQADYIGVKEHGPFKTNQYRY